MLGRRGGQPLLRAWDGRGFTRRTRYDALRRPTHLLRAAGTAASEILAERTRLRRGAGGAEATNLRGKRLPAATTARASSRASPFDFKGNLLADARQRARAHYQASPTGRRSATLTDAAASRRRRSRCSTPEVVHGGDGLRRAEPADER